MPRYSTRRTQPFRATRARKRGPVLAAMKRGKPRYAPNPMDAKRKVRKRLRTVLMRRY